MNISKLIADYLAAMLAKEKEVTITIRKGLPYVMLKL